MGLKKYSQKRAFERTPEPPARVRAGEGPLLFVVQKHRARQLHYDFRLELDGVLKSWSVPKGPSLDPQAKHLAVMVEDHPLDYASFEGVIPKGEYGAGEVIVWDTGAYSPDEGGRLLFDDRGPAEERMRQGLEKGKLSFTLRGQKLKGSWTLVRMKQGENNWLLMKHRDEYASADADVLNQAQSVMSGRSVEDVKAGRQPDPRRASAVDPATLPGARKAAFPAAVSPMLASLAEGPFSDPAWIFEPKLDGYRTIAFMHEGRVTLRSRRGNDVTEKFGALVPDLERQPASKIVLDGEIIALDENGKQCFQCLQNYLGSLRLRSGQVLRRSRANKVESYPLVYYVFDILYLDGYDLTGVSLRFRKSLLGTTFTPTGQVMLVDYFQGEGDVVYKAAIENGLEGVIAKEAESTYEPGRRSKHWLKIKATKSDEFVIGGYSVGEGRSRTFSSLLLGYFDDEGRLVFAGHVGSGFDEATLSDLKARLDALKTGTRPFSEEPPLNAPTTWVKPELVAEVKFAERTQEGLLRQPVFLRLREDKSPAEVRKTRAVAAPAPEADPPSVSDGVSDILEQLLNPKESFTMQVEGSRIKLTNVGKTLWPATKAHPDLTKRHLLIYLANAAPYLLPHLKDRPLSLNRYPDGIYGEHFYQKHWGHPVPDFVQTVNIREDKGARREYILCNNLPTLLWLGQAADLELHTWFSRVSAKPDKPPGESDADSLLDYPDFIIFDIDPYVYSGKEKTGDEPALSREGFARAGEVALWLKEVLDELALKAFVKTSGKTGLHIHAPIVRRLDYQAVRSAAETIGGYLLQRHPKEITMEWAVEKRKGKIFIDYGQNVRGKTLASVYSPRPAPEGAVSTPLRWEELGKVYPTDFTILTLPERLARMGDLWAGILEAKRDLGEVLDKGAGH